MGTFATFWLTDTPCNEGERLPLAGDHGTHNTLGICDDGMGTGLVGGAPDLMHVEQPFLDPDYPDDEQPLYDYSTDVEPTANGDADKGLQLRKPSPLVSAGCLLNLPPLESTPHQKMHRWLAPPIPDAFELLLDGEATLSPGRTIDGAVHDGRICVWLSRRRLNLLGQPVDTPLVSQQITNSPGSRAARRTGRGGDYQEITVEMDFVSAIESLLPGEQLGVAISVERSGTDGDGLEFMYDHPSFDSRLQLKTSSALPIFD